MAWFQILDLLESGLLRRREVCGILVHAFTPITHIFLPYSWFSVFLSFSYLFSLFSFFSCCCCCCLLCTFVVFLYCLLWHDLPFLPINCFWPVGIVFPRLPTGQLAAQLPPLHCVSCATPYSQTKVIFETPIRIRVGLLPYNLYSMHLVISAYVYLFWMRCHSSRIFPPKELK